MIKDESKLVRSEAAYALGSTFPHVTEKAQVWNDLRRLASDEDDYVRVFANHSLGRASIFRATEAETYDGFRAEFKISLKFFEESIVEDTHFNLSKFCFLFYRSFYVITFEKDDSEAEVQRYLSEAKIASQGSKSKEELLQIVEILAKALEEAQREQDRNIDVMKCYLNVYRKYCEPAANLIQITENNAPIATKLICRGIPIIDHKIRYTITEIQEKSKSICRQTKGTDIERLGAGIDHWAGELSDENYQEIGASGITAILVKFSGRLTKDKRGNLYKIINEINEEINIGYKLTKIELALTYLDMSLQDIELKDYKAKLDQMSTDVSEIKSNLIDLRQIALSRFDEILIQLDESEKSIVSRIIEQLDRDQLAMIETVLDAIEKDSLHGDQLQETLAAIQQTISGIEQQKIDLPRNLKPEDVERLSSVLKDTTLEEAYRLKVALPIVPFLVSLEHDIELKGGMNLSVAWERLVSKVRGR